MAKIENKWANIHNAFNPIEPVPLDKLDDWYVGRLGSPLESLLNGLAPEKLPQRLLMVGHRASGKSTELIKLSAELARRYDYFVVYVPLESNLDIEKVNPVEIIYLMGAALYKMAAERLKRKPNPGHMENLKNDLDTIVTTHTENKKFSLDMGETLQRLACYAIAGVAGLVAGPGVGALASEAAKLFMPKSVLSTGISSEVVRKREVEPAIATMVRHLNELINDICAQNSCQLALIVDGLDKPENPEVIALNFAQKRFLAEVDCRVVYAAPIAVYYSPDFAPTRGIFPALIEIPNVRLHERENPTKKEREGYRFMRMIVEKRLTSLKLRTEEVVTPKALDMLIQASGGVVRDLVFLIRDTADRAEIAGKGTIDASIARSSVSYWRRLYAATLIPRRRRILRTIRATHQRTDDAECDTLLRGNFILSYLENGLWFDIHSIFREEDLAENGSA